MKPLVFLSHSSRDAEAMIRLKQLLVARTSGTINFFLSSDGASIAIGRNWVDQVFSALSEASVFLAFLSPSSLQSQWMFFEAGLAYQRHIQVVPIGISGVNIGEIPPPLGLLQGFNLQSPEGLARIIGILNVALSHSHSPHFTVHDFATFEGRREPTAPIPDGTHAFRVLSITPDGEREHELLTLEVAAPRMTARTAVWESFGIVEKDRFVGRFKLFRGSAPRDLGIHDFTWNGKEFLGSAKVDSGGWAAENLIWRPIQ